MVHGLIMVGPIKSNEAKLNMDKIEPITKPVRNFESVLNCLKIDFWLDSDSLWIGSHKNKYQSKFTNRDSHVFRCVYFHSIVTCKQNQYFETLVLWAKKHAELLTTLLQCIYHELTRMPTNKVPPNGRVMFLARSQLQSNTPPMQARP